MNGKKILNKLIGLFLGINVILLILNTLVNSKEYRLSDERINNVIEVLDKQGIKVSASLPKTYKKKKSGDLSFEGTNARYKVEKNFFGSNLVSVKHSTGKSKLNPASSDKVQYCTFNGEVLIFDGDAICYENQNISGTKGEISLEEAKRFCQSLIKRVSATETGALNVEYQSTKEGFVLTYYPAVDGLSVADSPMIFKVCNQGVTSAVMYLGNLSMNNDEKEIYPIDLVLFNLTDYIKHQGGKKISNVTLVYKRLSLEADIWAQQIVPAYKISIDGLEEAIFVNAYNNEVIK